MRVFVAMSGGVDSSLAAALLVQAGHEVVGITLQLLPEGDDPGSCCGTDAVRSAKRVCDAIGIPHYVWNARDIFKSRVIEPYCDAYALGRTPNPCMVCNSDVKFGWMLARALENGAEALATGHYARTLRDESGVLWLARGVDQTKDQSYFLYDLSEQQLRHIMFPLGELTKSRVRELAAHFDLPSAQRPESQDACFVESGRNAEFVGSERPNALVAGDILDTAGVVRGRHSGIARYTIGQRKGLGIGGLSEPLHVIRVDAHENQVIVGPARELQATIVTARPQTVRALDGTAVHAVIRYRMPEQEAVVHVTPDSLEVHFVAPVSGVAPGQSVVCYVGDRVVAGGEINCAQ